MLHLSKFVWTLLSSAFVVFNNFLLTDETDRSQISSDKKRFFIALSLYPLSEVYKSRYAEEIANPSLKPCLFTEVRTFECSIIKIQKLTQNNCSPKL